MRCLWCWLLALSGLLYAQSTYYVDALNGNDANSGLTPSQAKKTIQAAINSANNGDTIRIANGTYIEALIINKSLTLIGQDSALTILQAPAKDSCRGCALVRCIASQVQLQQLSFQHHAKDAQYTIEVQGGHCEIYQCRFQCTGHYLYGDWFDKTTAIRLKSTLATVVVKESSFYGFYGIGILLADAPCLTQPCFVENNYFYFQGDQAITYLWNQNGGIVHVKNNVFGGDSEMGLTFNKVSENVPPTWVLITGNQFSNRGNYAQLSLQWLRNDLSGIRFLIQDNTFLIPDSGVGIRLEGGKDVKILRNTFKGLGRVFACIHVDNAYDARKPDSLLQSPTAVAIDSNRFEAQTTNYGFAIRFLRSDTISNDNSDYLAIQIGNTNEYDAKIRYWIDFRTFMGPNIPNRFDLQLRSFPFRPDHFSIEDKIIHRLDDLYFRPERPLVVWAPDSFFITHQFDFPLRIDNTTIQEAIDLAQNNAHIFVKGKTPPYIGNLLFNKALHFHVVDTPIIDGKLTVLLPSASLEVIQYGSFSYQGDTFKVLLGDWNLNGGVIYFSPKSYLQERLYQTIKGDSGYIETYRFVGQPAGEDIAGFGAILETNRSIGNLLLRRGHNEQKSTGFGSILRWFDIIPENEEQLQARFTFRYDPSELNGKDSAALQMYYSQNGGLSYEGVGGNVISGYKISKDNVNRFSIRWTLSDRTAVLGIWTQQTTACRSQGVRLEATPGFYDYLWSTGDTGRVLIAQESGTYYVTAINPTTGQRDTSNVFQVVILPDPVVTTAMDGDPCQTLTLSVKTEPGYQVQWSTGDTGSTLTLSKIVSQDTIWAQVYNAYCQIAYPFVVSPCGELPLKIPNAFSPNGDGINDTWFIENLWFYPDNEVVIYNRWGNLVYRAAPYNNDWDGNGLPDGTYYYVLTIKSTGQTYKGFVAIKR